MKVFSPLCHSSSVQHSPEFANQVPDLVERLHELLNKRFFMLPLYGYLKRTAVLGRVALMPFQWYHRQLTNNPLAVKSLTSGVMLSTADFLSQWLRSPLAKEHPAPNQEADVRRSWWNPSQTMWMGVYGVCFVSPFCHVWYQVPLSFPIDYACFPSLS